MKICLHLSGHGCEESSLESPRDDHSIRWQRRDRHPQRARRQGRGLKGTNTFLFFMGKRSLWGFPKICVEVGGGSSRHIARLEKLRRTGQAACHGCTSPLLSFLFVLNTSSLGMFRGLSHVVLLSFPQCVTEHYDVFRRHDCWSNYFSPTSREWFDPVGTCYADNWSHVPSPSPSSHARVSLWKMCDDEVLYSVGPHGLLDIYGCGQCVQERYMALRCRQNAEAKTRT